MTAVGMRARRRDEVHFLAAGDGTPLTLIHVCREDAEPTKGAVMLVHGVGMRAESFRPPHRDTIVEALLLDGWDVWMLNWRGSTDLDAVPWVLDDVAQFDIPAGVRHIVTETGSSPIKVVAHCQGAAVTSMAAVTGLLPEVDAIVANGVSLHPVVRPFARVKLRVIRPILSTQQSYVDIAWGDGPEKGIRRVTRNAVRLWHTECRAPGCNMASFALGSGHPALWLHSNLDKATHEWVQTEFGKVPLSYYAQLTASDRAGQYVSVRPGAGRPARYAAAPPKTDARFTLITGAHNHAFLPASQQATMAFLERHQPGRHSLEVIPGYGHADVFLGRGAHVDVFPRILRALNA
ncbi:alpha/beta fold hydrolase [Microbacterium sp. 2FI]|uniref:alpha/beta hydrolase n=1 Tax=Microbacterium sp. 2FI TaxID=2502193 RepID=UPI0010F8CE67|nr:alpha/beta fold hydrolase [Microbacterium sp. 2FI]